MAKDPAFLFYPSDFLTGTMFMTDAEVGKYIRLICAQHQHGGILDKVSFNAMVGENQIIKSKFIESETGFYNERLTIEMDKRNKKSNNMSEVAKEVWKNRKMQLHTKNKENKYKSNTKVNKIDTIVIQPVNINEDENKSVIINKNKTIKPKKLFKDSEYFNIEVLTEALEKSKPPYCNAHVGYYYESMELWSRQNNEKKIDWLATCQNWILKDISEGKFKDKNFNPQKNNKYGTSKTNYPNNTSPYDDWGK